VTTTVDLPPIYASDPKPRRSSWRGFSVDVAEAQRDYMVARTAISLCTAASVGLLFMNYKQAIEALLEWGFTEESILWLMEEEVS
jgi:hypothetical protein